MTRDTVVLPLEVVKASIASLDSEFQTLAARRKEVGLEITEICAEISSAKTVSERERSQASYFRDVKARRRAYARISEKFIASVEPLEEKLKQLRIEFREATTSLASMDEQLTRLRAIRNTARREKHEQYMRDLNTLTNLPEGDIRSVAVRSLETLRRLHNERLLLPEECSLLPQLSRFIDVSIEELKA